MEQSPHFRREGDGERSEFRQQVEAKIEEKQPALEIKLGHHLNIGLTYKENLGYIGTSTREGGTGAHPAGHEMYRQADEQAINIEALVGDKRVIPEGGIKEAYTFYMRPEDLMTILDEA